MSWRPSHAPRLPTRQEQTQRDLRVLQPQRTGASHPADWSLWLIDCLARLLAIICASWLLLWLVASFIGGGGSSWNPLGWIVGSYLGFVNGAMFYLPLLLLSARLWRRWRPMALLLSPVISAGGLTVVLPWVINPLGSPLVATMIVIGPVYGAIVPSPSRHARHRLIGTLALMLAVSFALAAAVIE